MKRDIPGGYCGGVPPLPIPNREVKPACADGTAMQCGRVGGRLLFEYILAGVPEALMLPGRFFSCPWGSFVCRYILSHNARYAGLANAELNLYTLCFVVPPLRGCYGER